MLRKNEIVTLRIEDMSDEGLGIGHTDEGVAVFVKDTVIGDSVRASITKVKKTYAFGRVAEILTPSPDRVTPRCPVARSCGGCQIQEMSYPAQLHFKENKVLGNIRRIGGIACRKAGQEQTAEQGPESGQEQITEQGPESEQKQWALFCPIIGSSAPFHYRNKSEYPVGRDKNGKLVAGFYAGRTHTIVSGAQCVIGIEENQPILNAVLGWMETFHIPEYQEETGKGLVRNIMIRCGFSTGQIMVVIVANADRLPHETELVKKICGALPKTECTGTDLCRAGSCSGESRLAGNRLGGAHLSSENPIGEVDSVSDPYGAGRIITGIILNTNKERTNVILGRKNRTLWGRDSIEDKIGAIRYRISPLSFYQVNPYQTRTLYETARSYAELTGEEIVWDLYCGTGTISLFLAPYAKQVYGVEVVPDAIVNARENAKLNHIDNVQFLAGKAEEVLPREYQEHQIHADVIVVDPPRKGLEGGVIDTIAAMEPKRVVYISCNSATLARDLAIFAQKGYQTRKVQPVDMFPQGVHVETVALLSKLHESKHHVNVKLDMDELDLTSAEAKATYKEIEEWVQEHYGFHVTNLNIAQVKQKHGIIERENYNKPESEDSRQPGCPEEKVRAIEEALKYFQIPGLKF
jgi:23S rRNA (uracil1939-C5)-methyltransferase